MGRRAVQDTVASHRRQLRAGSARAAQVLANAYAVVRADLEADHRRLVAATQAAQAAGVPVDADWVRRSGEYRRLIANYDASLRRLAPLVGSSASTTAQAATALAGTSATELIAAASAAAADAAVSPVAFTAVNLDAGPLASLVSSRAAGHVDQASRILLTSAAKGTAPRLTANALLRTTDNAFLNAYTVVRTEQLRAYRETTRAVYQANDAVKRWRWDARCTDRTCADCWALHGQEFDNDTPMDTHPNCMCVLVPVVDGVEYGPTGADLFDDLSDTEQRAILGPSAHAAYKDGAVTLRDLSSAGSLTAALGETRAASYVAAARA